MKDSTMSNNINALGFNGEYLDDTLANYHLGNGYRAYNPTTMQFTAPDDMSPFGHGGINPYMYVSCDPINNTDPTGHFHINLGGWLGIGIGGVGGVGLGAISIATAFYTAGLSAIAIPVIGLALGVVSVGLDIGAQNTNNKTISNILEVFSIGLGITSAFVDIYGAAKPVSELRLVQTSRTYRRGIVSGAKEIRGAFEWMPKKLGLLKPIETIEPKMELNTISRSLGQVDRTLPSNIIQREARQIAATSPESQFKPESRAKKLLSAFQRNDVRVEAAARAQLNSSVVAEYTFEENNILYSGFCNENGDMVSEQHRVNVKTLERLI